MSKIWITYNWKDNEDKDVDFIAQELINAGVEIKLDRWNISAGKRLWSQIETFIKSKEESDAWILVATNNSLASEPCKEEYAYALDRALHNRGEDFPVIGLFLNSINEDLIPSGIKTRLYVSITDPDWKERIIAAAEKRSIEISKTNITPYYLKVHTVVNRDMQFAIEMRPRAGVWAPFIAAIPKEEKTMVDPQIMIGPRNIPTRGGMLVNYSQGESMDKWISCAGNQATPTESYFLWCKVLPSSLIFGVNDNSSLQFLVKF